MGEGTMLTTQKGVVRNDRERCKNRGYRDLSEYWISRLTRYGDDEKLNDRLYANLLSNYPIILKLNIEGSIIRFAEFESIKFSYGYTKRTMAFECKGITIGRGKKEWAPPMKMYLLSSLENELNSYGTYDKRRAAI